MTTPLHILLIEDDLVDQMAFTAQVAAEKLPYAVQIAKSVAEARTLLKACVFDLVISDYHLGDGTAFELFDQFGRQLVILATGAGDEEIAVRALRLGVRDYIIKDPERRYLKLLSHRIDSVTHQARGEEALRDSETRYRELFESASDLIQSIAPDGRILFVNRAWRDALGYSEEEVRDLKLANLLSPATFADYMGKFRQLLKGEPLGIIETTYVTKDGREILLEGNASCHFTDGEPVSARAIFRDVTDARRADAALKAALKEKEVMLQEIHHRVKNNLQIVSSLLNLQARGFDDPAMRSAFAESQQRIRSMALIHEMLYQSENLAELDFGVYLHTLVPALMRSYGPQAGRVSHDIQADELPMRPQTAVPLALIVNELITNSLKHAFPTGSGGRIDIECRRRGTEIALSVRDNGPGLPPGFSIGKATTLGLRLVGIMAKQLPARIESRNHDGAVFEFTFTPLGDPPPRP